MSPYLCPICGTSKTKLAARKTLCDDLLSRLLSTRFDASSAPSASGHFSGGANILPRRRFDRVRVAFPVWFRAWDAGPLAMGQEGVIENLSIRGCRIRCGAPMPKGIRLELEFQPRAAHPDHR